MWLVVASQDVDSARQALDEAWRQSASSEELAAAGHVVDHDGDQIACPACLTSFAPGAEHCPDCGLRVG